MPDPGRIHRPATSLMSVAMVVIGIALIVRTLAAGGTAISTGILLGALFIAGGALRLYVQSRSR
jgi:hypothetical protein